MRGGWKTLLTLASLKELKLAWHGSTCLYPALRRWKQENFEVILSRIVSSRPAWSA